MLSLSYFPSPSIDPCYNLPLQRTDFFLSDEPMGGGGGGGYQYRFNLQGVEPYTRTKERTVYYSGRQVVEHHFIILTEK